MTTSGEHQAGGAPRDASPTLPKRKNYLVLFVSVMSVAIIVLLVAILWLVLSKDSGARAPEDILEKTAAMQSIDFPLYYPKQLPEDFSISADSIAAQEARMISFSITSPNGGQLLVTEQPRPPIMEEVQKSVEFKTQSGDAYIANLNGRVAGFIRTEKTLIILSVMGEVPNDSLRQIMNEIALL